MAKATKPQPTAPRLPLALPDGSPPPVFPLDPPPAPATCSSRMVGEVVRLARLRFSGDRREEIIATMVRGMKRLAPGFANRPMRWADVNAVHHPTGGEDEARPVRFTLVGRGDRRLEFPAHLPEVDDLLALVERYTLPHMAPPAREALAAGEGIRFGVLSIHRDGLSHDRDCLPWDRFVSAERDARR